MAIGVADGAKADVFTKGSDGEGRERVPEVGGVVLVVVSTDGDNDDDDGGLIIGDG